jgi:hypothetical protein
MSADLAEVAARFNGEAPWRSGREKADDMTAVLDALGTRYRRLRLLPPSSRRRVLAQCWDKLAKPYAPPEVSR